MRLALFECEPHEREFFERHLTGHELTFFADPLSETTAREATEAEAVSVFVYSQVNESVLSWLPHVKLVTTRSMGFNHIDLAACVAHGITVAYVPAYGERTVAEHTMALILALSRKIFQAYERTEKGVFDYRGLTGFDLYGKTIGLVGGGRIGLNVARLARAFGMEVLVSDPYPKPELASEIGFTYTPLETLLQKADVISLHAPYSAATHHLLNDEKLKLVKRGAILVNTARGGLLDTAALLKALDDGRLAGAGLDVLEEECAIHEEYEVLTQSYAKKCDLATLLRNHLLIARDNVIITPHIAFNSREALERIMSTTVANIQGFADGKPVNLVPSK